MRIPNETEPSNEVTDCISFIITLPVVLECLSTRSSWPSKKSVAVGKLYGFEIKIHSRDLNSGPRVLQSDALTTRPYS